MVRLLVSSLLVLLAIVSTLTTPSMAHKMSTYSALSLTVTASMVLAPSPVFASEEVDPDDEDDEDDDDDDLDDDEFDDDYDDDELEDEDDEGAEL
jgi:hypothetical protein